MDIYLSYISAAKALGVPDIDTIVGYPTSLQTDIQVTVPTRNQMRKVKGYEVYYSDGRLLPEGALINVNGCVVTSPEMLFVQMGSKLSLHRLILLGMQLCSLPSGMYSNSLTSTEKLAAFVSRSGQLAGVKNARRALKYVKNRSASRVESINSMLFELPHSMGGYNFKGISLNHCVPIMPNTLIGQKECFIDLCFGDIKVGIEYMSNEHHDEAKLKEDHLRSIVLGQMGYTMIWMTTDDLYQLDRFQQKADEIARLTGQRIRIRHPRFLEEQEDLHALLPSWSAVDKIKAPIVNRSGLITPITAMAKRDNVEQIWNKSYVDTTVMSVNFQRV